MKVRFFLIVLLSALSPDLSWGFEEYDCDNGRIRLSNQGLVQAAIDGDAGAISCIIDSDSPGVDVNSEDEAGRTPLYWAAINDHEDAIRMLLLR